MTVVEHHPTMPLREQLLHQTKLLRKNRHLGRRTRDVLERKAKSDVQGCHEQEEKEGMERALLTLWTF